jgi:genome maintenance exonuclease 1
MLTNPYKYHKLTRESTTRGRYYLTPGNIALPSVTTILDKTKDKTHLIAWRKRVGEAEAQRITTEAAGRGTTMHKFIENWLHEAEKTPGSNLVQQHAHKMATVMIEQVLKPNLTEAWGNEIPLYFPELYAGTCDLVGTWNGTPAIMDFKQSNKPKKREWIEDYFCQLVAYAECHNEVYGTDINKGVVLVCTKDLEPQIFEIEGDEWTAHQAKWWERVEKYYKDYHGS